MTVLVTQIFWMITWRSMLLLHVGGRVSQVSTKSNVKCGWISPNSEIFWLKMETTMHLKAYLSFYRAGTPEAEGTCAGPKPVLSSEWRQSCWFQANSTKDRIEQWTALAVVGLTRVGQVEGGSLRRLRSPRRGAAAEAGVSTQPLVLPGLQLGSLLLFQ